VDLEEIRNPKLNRASRRAMLLALSISEFIRASDLRYARRLHAAAMSGRKSVAGPQRRF
jgi:hypothetical protein